MSPKSFLLNDDLHSYLLASSTPLDEVARSLIEETASLGDISRMQVAPEQGLLLTLLARLARARRAVEVGTFTGFSALCIARGLPGDGSLICLDRSEEWTAVARRYWARAGLDHRIDLRLGDALPSLRALPPVETFDLAFVDAVKTGYPAYVEELYGRMRPNGVVLLDNTLRKGKVLAPESDDDRAVVALNAALAEDPRWETVLLPLADGLTMLRRR